MSFAVTYRVGNVAMTLVNAESWKCHRSSADKSSKSTIRLNNEE
jgi:hypothetical protein